MKSFIVPLAFLFASLNAVPDVGAAQTKLCARLSRRCPALLAEEGAVDAVDACGPGRRKDFRACVQSEASIPVSPPCARLLWRWWHAASRPDCFTSTSTTTTTVTSSTTTTSTSNGLTTSTIARRAGSEMTGDGKADLIVIWIGGQLGVARSNGASFDLNGLPFTWFATNLPPGRCHVFGDFDGDGLLDVLSSSGGQIYFSRSTGTTLAAPVSWGPAGTFVCGGVAADVDGDGRADLIRTQQTAAPTSTELARVAVYVRRSNGHGLLAEELWKDPADGVDIWYAPGIFFGDFDGDGRVDMAGTDLYDLTIRVALSDGHRFVFQNTPWLKFAPGAPPYLFGRNDPPIDVNGDGRNDIAFVWQGKVWVSTSTGTGFTTPRLWTTTSTTSTNTSIGFADYNGDGRTDYSRNDRLTGDIFVALSDGTRFLSERKWGRSICAGGPGPIIRCSGG